MGRNAAEDKADLVCAALTDMPSPMLAIVAWRASE